MARHGLRALIAGAISIATGVAVIEDARRISGNQWGGYSKLGSKVRPLFHTGFTMYSPVYFDGVVQFGPDGTAEVEQLVERRGRVLPDSGVRGIGFGYHPDGGFRTGLWAMTRQTFYDPLWLHVDSRCEDQSAMTAEEEAAARDEILEFAIAKGIAIDLPEQQLSLLLGTTETRVLISGYIHNTVTLALIATCVWSGFRCVVNTRKCWFEMPWRRPGVCPKCYYDMTGLDRCPECGWTKNSVRDSPDGAADAETG